LYNFCILTGINYFSKAIALYESLSKHCDDFKLFYFCFDDDTYRILSLLNYKNIIPINIKEVEDQELLNAKSNRSVQEYYFTLTPSIILYVLKRYNVKMCTYLDADIYFYSDPKILFKEMDNNSVLITEHRYATNYEYLYTSGKYCVQFNPFRNNKEGLTVLRWWRDACTEWCYHKAEDGKWADQGYLNDWTTRFNSVHVLNNLGGGMAPWNIQKYSLVSNSSDLIIFKNLENGENFQLIFYHFQALRFLTNNLVYLGGYKLEKNIISRLYKKYVGHLLIINNKIKKLDPTVNILGIELPSPFYKSPYIILKYLIHNQLLFDLNNYGEVNKP